MLPKIEIFYQNNVDNLQKKKIIVFLQSIMLEQKWPKTISFKKLIFVQKLRGEKSRINFGRN